MSLWKIVFQVKPRGMSCFYSAKQNIETKTDSLRCNKLPHIHKQHTLLQLWGLSKCGVTESTTEQISISKKCVKLVLSFLSFYSFIVYSPKVSEQHLCVCMHGLVSCRPLNPCGLKYSLSFITHLALSAHSHVTSHIFIIHLLNLFLFPG